MVMPCWQTCPKCFQRFLGSDALGQPCPSCQGIQMGPYELLPTEFEVQETMTIEEEDDEPQVEWIPHCDMENCDLGTVDYKCPVCNKDCTSFDAWWAYDDVVQKGGEAEMECVDCGADLIIYWDAKQQETRVRVADHGG